ncbi:unnamed protein product [Heterobilharzia americana]|nr:unnamed protein product [Heterobilharzia americana]
MKNDRRTNLQSVFTTFTANCYSNHYENYAVCPVGVLFVLTTLLGSNGIRQNTARQVKYALKIQRNENFSARQRAKNLYLFLKKSLSAEKTVIQQNEVNVVSAETGVFLKQKYPFDKRFKRLVKNEFMCEVENVDFEDQTASVSMIKQLG